MRVCARSSPGCWPIGAHGGDGRGCCRPCPPGCAREVASELLRGISMSGPWSGRRLHFIGVGGAGMSAYARAAHALGAEISGSDGSGGPYLERLAADGILDAAIGHRAENIPPGSEIEVFYSSAVGAENVERLAARERGLPERPRAQLLGELSAMRRTIAVAGTHGKTTTASMIAHALFAAGMRPGWLVGAPIGGGLANAQWGEGEWLVVEADESDRSMLSLSVEIALLTNVELDHHTAFSSLAELERRFARSCAGAYGGRGVGQAPAAGAGSHERRYRVGRLRRARPAARSRRIAF